jgi:RNA polymerase sigma factor (sigma-70 family)
MDDAPSPYIARILACEAAIVRIRAAKQAGQLNSDQVADDVNLILATAVPIFVRRAREIAWLGPIAAEEAVEAMTYRLQIDILSATFPSLETGFGAYLKTMPVHTMQTIQRKNMLGSDSSPMERLDAPIAEDGMLLHETVSDPHAISDFQALADHEEFQQALDHLPPQQRLALELRSQGHSNTAVADRLGVSSATATRLYQRARDQLKHQLRASEE